MADNKAHYKCASSIALLEGRASLELPGDIISASTLGALDIRLRRVEAFYDVALPPACQAPAWDTLAYRVFRLIKAYRTFPPVATGGMFTPKHFLELVPDPSNVSSETLQTLCSDLGYRSYNWTKSLALANPSNELSVYSQICCYYAGKSKQLRVVAIPTTRADIYGLLAVLSVENGPAIKQPMSPPIPPPFGLGKLPPGVTVVNAAPHQKKKPKRSILSKFSWMKKLAFWRKRRSDDDSSIYSSSSSVSSSSSTIS
ncbi:hypothetical protein V2G26_005853 [Clonostachys chloroleuca]|uniref:Uncharacterized protein n=1 Tax=Clonostachys chloroleuca TaxID=1926264 RepID=A0AA35QC05_9HYPO|nr:unnamed protein product [Clonostachys chloroleuca]